MAYGAYAYVCRWQKKNRDGPAVSVPNARRHSRHMDARSHIQIHIAGFLHAQWVYNYPYSRRIYIQPSRGLYRPTAAVYRAHSGRRRAESFVMPADNMLNARETHCMHRAAAATTAAATAAHNIPYFISYIFGASTACTLSFVLAGIKGKITTWISNRQFSSN